MLDQLVESKSHAGEDTKRGSLLLTTFVVMVTVLLSAYLYSLFAKDYTMGGDELSLETLVAPPIIEEAPEPEPEKQPEKQKDPNVDIRKEIIATIDEAPPPVPPKISAEKFTGKVRNPDRFTALGNVDSDAKNPMPVDYKGPVNTTGTGSDSGNPGQGGTADVAPGPPPPPPPPKKEPPKTISGGVLNGKATSLPKPPYPPAARAVRASGAVSVQVLISETGSVVSANAVSGHPLLRPAAVAAARGARFSPTLLSGQPVKVSGVITYNFVP
jgi:periplasmic protein TonB